MMRAVLLALFGLWGGEKAVVHEDPVVRRALAPYVASGELPRAVTVRMKDADVKFECFGGAKTNEAFAVSGPLARFGFAGPDATVHDVFTMCRTIATNQPWQGRRYRTVRDLEDLGFVSEGDGSFALPLGGEVYVWMKPCWHRLKLVWLPKGAVTDGGWFASWKAAVDLAFDPRGRVNELRKAMTESAKAGDVAKTQALGEEAAELDGNTLESCLRVSEAARNAKQFDVAEAWAEKAFAVNRNCRGRSFHCTAALIDSMKSAKGTDATLDRLEEIVEDWERYLPEKRELTTVLSQYCFLASNKFRYARVRKGIAWFKAFDVPYGAHMERSLLQTRLMDELEDFPRPEGEIAFGKTLADFGVADTNVVHARDFGWNAENATAALQKAMDSGATTVVLDDMGSPWRICCVTNRSNQRILFRKGVKVLADRATAELCSKNYDLFRAWKCQNVIFEGEGDNCIGCYANYDERRKWNKTYGMNGISLSATKNVVIRNLRIAECSMDAVFFAGSFPVNESTWLENLVLDSCYRQAMSVCGAVDTYCKNVTFSNTRGAAPTAGIDLEPAIECYPDANLYLFDCRFEGNQGGGLVFYTSTYTPVTTYAKRCTFAANGPTPIEVFARCGIYMGANVRAPSKIVIEDCDLETFSDTPALSVQSCSLFDVTLKDCRMRDSGQLRRRKGRTSTPIRFSLNRDFGPDGIPEHMVGRIRFENVTADGWKGSPLVSFSDELGMLDIKDVLSGTIRFNGEDVDVSDFEYTAPDRRAAPLEMPDLAKLPPPARKVGADEVYASNMSLSWNGAWFQSRPVYNILYWADAGRVVKIDDVAITNTVTGWHAYLPPNQKTGWSFKTMTGARPVYLGDVYGNFMAKFVLKDVKKGYTGYFRVPRGESALRLTWGSLDIRNPAGEVVDSAEQGVYDGRHVFALKNASGEDEIWSFTAWPSYSTHVLRFYRPLDGYWADDPADLPVFVDPSASAALVAANEKVAAGWDDQLLSEGVDWGFLPAAERAKVDGLKALRRAYGEKGEGIAALADELAKIEEIKKNASSEANLRDANEELKNLPPLERRAALEKCIRAERDATSRLASYVRLKWDSIPAAVREKEGVSLVDGQVEYRDVKGLVALKSLVK